VGPTPFNSYPPVPFGPYTYQSFPGGGGVGAPPLLYPTGVLGTSTLTGGGYGGGYGGATLSTNPYGGGSATLSTNPYYGGGFSGLDNAAGITTANANYHLTIQSARIQREAAYRAMLETQKALRERDEEWARNRPTPEQLQARAQAQALEQARTGSPVTDIYSGRALNDLLDHLANEQAKGHAGTKVPVDPAILKSINVTGRGSRANPGLLKGDGKIPWPYALMSDEFGESRRRLEKLFANAADQLKNNNAVQAGDIRDMRANLQQMRDALEDRVADMAPSDYITARRALNQIDDAVRGLEDPRAANLVNQKLQADNVPELVQYMRNNGLRFAPAVPGDEQAYGALYDALRRFDRETQNRGTDAARAPERERAPAEGGKAPEQPAER
jgi:hypothetical protein